MIIIIIFWPRSYTAIKTHVRSGEAKIHHFAERKYQLSPPPKNFESLRDVWSIKKKEAKKEVK